MLVTKPGLQSSISMLCAGHKAWVTVIHFHALCWSQSLGYSHPFPCSVLVTKPGLQSSISMLCAGHKAWVTVIHFHALCWSQSLGYSHPFPCSVLVTKPGLQSSISMLCAGHKAWVTVIHFHALCWSQSLGYSHPFPCSVLVTKPGLQSSISMLYAGHKAWVSQHSLYILLLYLHHISTCNRLHHTHHNYVLTVSPIHIQSPYKQYVPISECIFYKLNLTPTLTSTDNYIPISSIYFVFSLVTKYLQNAQTFQPFYNGHHQCVGDNNNSLFFFLLLLLSSTH